MRIPNFLFALVGLVLVVAGCEIKGCEIMAFVGSAMILLVSGYRGCV